MKRLILILSGILMMILGMDQSWASLRDVTENNVQAAAQSFGMKVVKGKLDKEGYGSLREKIGPLSKDEKLVAGSPGYIEGSFLRDQERQRNIWSVPVFKLIKSSKTKIGPLFSAVVTCEIYRYRQFQRYNNYQGYQWYPDCRVSSVYLNDL